MWQRFTERARKVVFYAQEEAQRYGEGYVSTEHLLLGILREPEGLSAMVIESICLTLEEVRIEVEKQLPKGDPQPRNDMTLTPRAKRVIDLAYDEARRLNNNYIGTEHLLLGMVREADGLAGRILIKLGLTLDVTRRGVIHFQNLTERPRTAPIETPKPPRSYSWDQYDDVTQRAILLADVMAKTQGWPHVTPYFLAKALLAQAESTANQALKQAGLEPEELSRAIDANQVWTEGAPQIALSPAARMTIDRAMSEAAALDSDVLGSEALLLGLVFGNREGIGHVVNDCGISIGRLRDTVVEVLKSKE